MRAVGWISLLLLAGCAARRADQPRQAEHPRSRGGPPHHEGHHAHSSGHPAHSSEHHAHSAGHSPRSGHDPEQRPTAAHRFENAEAWSKVFDDPKRDAWQKPAELVAALAIAPDEVVVDLGTGTGYFVGHLSRAVPRGRVIAVDVEPNLLRFVEQRVERAGLTNVTTRLAEQDDPKLAEQVDLVLVVDTYHHLGQRSAYFRRLTGRLSARGRVVVVDFRMGKLPIGPPDDHKLPPEVVEREMKLAGYARCRAWDGLPYQYVLEFRTRCPAS